MSVALDGELQDLVRQQLAARAGLPADADPSAMLARLTEQDPRLAVIARYLAAHDAPTGDSPLPAVDHLPAELPAEPPGPSGYEVGALQELRRRVRQLCAERDRLQERNDVLAAALGACADCWGDDPACRWCRGEGAPGWASPHPVQYERYVTAAVRTPRPNPENGDGDAQWIRRGR